MHIPHRGLDSVVSGDVLQCKSVRILLSLGQKRMAKSVKSGIRIGFDFITQPAHLGFQDPRLEFLIGEQENVLSPFASELAHFDARVIPFDGLRNTRVNRTVR